MSPCIRKGIYSICTDIQVYMCIDNYNVGTESPTRHTEAVNNRRTHSL